MSEDAKVKFQTYLFFLRHFDRLIREDRSAGSDRRLIRDLVNEQKALLVGVAPITLTNAATEEIRRLLFNAWNCETVARLNTLMEITLRTFTNQWKAVQTYYALYFMLLAVHKLHAANVRPGHETTLRFAAQSIPHRFPSPWCCRYDFDQGTCQKFPWAKPPSVESGWNLTNHDDAHVFVSHFYRTTGEEKRYDRWLDHGKGKKHPPDHPKAGKRILISDKKGGVIAFWDALYRMRKWVNYKEAEALVVGQDYQPHVAEFDRRLNSILTASAALIEHFLHALLGDGPMKRMYRHYLRVAGGHLACASLKMRYDIICG